MQIILNPTIAIIDSGLGGVSVLREITSKYKVGKYIYYADNANMPYGNKSHEFIASRMDEIIDLLRNKYKVDIIIIACNTASSSISNTAKNVVTMTFDKNKIFLATRLTKKNLKDYKIIEDDNLAEDIENNILNPSKLEKIVKKHIKNQNLYNYDEIVLGCTHYELVYNYFIENCPNTKILKNSDNIISKLHIDYDIENRSVIVLLSKESNEYRNIIYKLIN